MAYNSSSDTSGAVTGLYGLGHLFSTGKANQTQGVHGIAQYSGTDTTNNMSLYGGRFQSTVTGTGTIGHAIGIKIDGPSIVGTVDEAYGLYLMRMDNQSAGTINKSSALHFEGAGENDAMTWAGNDGDSLSAKLFSPSPGKLTFKGNSNALQVAVTQTTVPTCSSNCDTSPSVTGADTAFTVTMGASGSPASGWVVTFNGTWAAAPTCIVQMGKAGMVAGKLPLTVVTTTTTMTVVTNGTAPATTDVYHAHCIGVQ
jgi:hypothetical protein